MHAPRWTTMLLAMALLLPASVLANPSAVISGPMRCGINGYGWPLSAEDAPIAADAGTMEIVSDGNGKFTSGQMTRHVGDDTRMAGTNVCTFDLEGGTYVQQPDGTTANTLSWKLRAGSDPHCGAIVTNSKYLGFVEGSRDFHSVTYTSTSYTLENGRIGYVGSSPQGVVIGVCEPMGK
jgi:hypothetical protein